MSKRPAGISYDSRAQLLLPFSAVRNENFLSNHWLQHRLPLEPEWAEVLEDAKAALSDALDIWRRERTRVEKYGNEQGLEHGFIQPMFEALGWSIQYQPYLQGRKPDYALFADPNALDAALSEGRTGARYWETATLVADAKAWHVSLDRPKKDTGKREYPPQQIEWYLDRSRKEYGILTNGRIWRLIPRDIGPGNPRFQTYLEVDLPEILNAIDSKPQATFEGEELAEFLRFYLLFGPTGHSAITRDRTLIARARSGSSEYRIGVGQDLRIQVFEALRWCMEGFINCPTNEIEPTSELDNCRQLSLVFLYRLLFIMYAEDRALLPYRVNRTYTKNHALARHRLTIADTLERARLGQDNDYTRDSYAIWEDLTTLFDLINVGQRHYGVAPFNGGLFEPDQHPELERWAISDWYLARVIDHLGRAPDRTHNSIEAFRVDFRDLTIKHLGTIYEGLLEARPFYATRDVMAVITTSQREGAKTFIDRSTPIPDGYIPTDECYRAGQVAFYEDKTERRNSGSYYTPDHIVSEIVEATLSPLCTEIGEDLEKEIQEAQEKLDSADESEREALYDRIESLQRQFDDRVLNANVLDPAMGSGHFLVSACQYLAEEIATHPYTGDPDADALDGSESVLTFWKRRVAERCLFGVDVNPMAVELSRLALWLETATTNSPLVFVEHHLRHGNALIGVSPSIVKHHHLDAAQIKTGKKSLTSKTRANKMTKAARAARDTVSGPSRSLKDVKGKIANYRRQVVRTLSSVKQVYDQWTSERMEPEDQSQAWHPFDAALFHWELEYPDVFSPDLSFDHYGFDAVVGNPPYEVLAEKEIGRSLDLFRSAISMTPSLHATKGGKNNLYKLFICRALELTREHGRIGFITPMALLGDEQAAGVRKALIESGAFERVHSFPQKDNPASRVFPDAKLSTCVFIYRKDTNSRSASDSFDLIVHPGGSLDQERHRVALRTQDIEVFDPINATIVSCSQSEWDLALKLLKNNKVLRLGQLAHSFQGEVNETTQGARGIVQEDPTIGPQVLRGANVCRYALREASQGRPKFINEDVFLSGKRSTSKAYHSQEKRVGFQRSSPQNNYRRLIACRIPEGYYCFDTVSYIPESHCVVGLSFILGVLNSNLAEWYFRLGSTNSKVNEYQFNNLPCPAPLPEDTPYSGATASRVLQAIEEKDASTAHDVLDHAGADLQMTPKLKTVVTTLVEYIEQTEIARGRVAKKERARLSMPSGPWQSLLDRIIGRSAGLSDSEIEQVHRSVEVRF
jgi:hypothetical protein